MGKRLDAYLCRIILIAATVLKIKASLTYALTVEAN